MKKTLSIFYTDDDREDQDIFREAASDMSDGFDISMQNNGVELISVLKRINSLPYAIFLDLNMHIKNGYEVLEEIRENINFKNIPVIIFTTSDDDNAIRKTKSLGANMFISKPTSFSAVRKAIRYTLAIDWNSFETNDQNFVYKA